MSLPEEPNASAGGAGAPPEPAEPNRADDLTRVYETGEITVEWYAGRCIHSANCVRGLAKVFNPRLRPWIDPTRAAVSDIASTILRCPSGALHFARRDGGPTETPDVPATFTPVRDGALYVRGDIEVRAADGSLLRRDTRIALCRCALTHKPPFCDNTCRAAGWKDSAGSAGSAGAAQSERL